MPGAFLVHWLEGVTLRPCAIEIRERDEVVAQTRLAYDQAGRLASVAAGERVQTLERDEAGRLRQAYGLAYDYAGDRVATLTETSGEPARTHTLRYDEAGALVGIQTALGDALQREHVLQYDDAGRMTERRWSEPAGAHAETFYTYDGLGRLARVDVAFTDAQGNERKEPAWLVEYDGERVAEFGGSVLAYDQDGRVRSLTTRQGVVAEYSYRCR